MDLLVVDAGVTAPPRPVMPVVHRFGKGHLRVDRPGQLRVRRIPGEHERDALTRLEHELGHGRQVLAVHLDRRAQAQAVGPGDRDARVVDLAHPGDDRAEVEPDHELRAHRHAAVQSLHDPHDVGRLATRRHEVDRADAALAGLVHGLEDQRVVAVASRRADDIARGREEPAAVLRPPEQRREAGARVEPGEAAPVDRPGSTDERGGLQVAE